MRLICIAIVATLTIVGAGAVRAGEEWKQVADESGVTAWRQETGGGLPIARASTTVDAPLCEVLAVIRDVARHCEWVADCVATRVLHRPDWPHVDMYLRIKGYPWVSVADRDAVMKTVTVVEEAGAKARVEFSAATADAAALAEDTVHMLRLTGAYRLTRVANNRTDVDYRFQADLGGWVPGWVGTRTVEQLPWRTLANLRSHVAKLRDRYRKEIESWPPGEAPDCAPGNGASAKP